MPKNSYVLLGVLQSYAPNGDAQEQCAKMYRRMRGGYNTEDEVVAEVAGALLDGLKYGNWPWVTVVR